MFSAWFWAKFKFLTQACQDDCTLGTTVIKYCFTVTAEENETKYTKHLGEYTDKEMDVLVFILYVYHFFTTWWEFSQTIYAATFSVSWVKVMFFVVYRCQACSVTLAHTVPVGLAVRMLLLCIFQLIPAASYFCACSITINPMQLTRQVFLSKKSWFEPL